MAQDRGLVVITGASRGIGRALARRFEEAGHPVLAVARSPADGEGAVAADLASQDGMAAVVAAVRARGVPVEVLINNAGMQAALDLTAPEAEREADTVAVEIALNLAAPILLARALLPLMRQPGATIVNVTSLVSRHPKPSAPVYSAGKAGLASFTASLRHQLVPLGIRVMEAVPPLVDTAMTEGRGRGKIPPEAMAEAIFEGVAKGRPLVAPGLARLVLLLDRLLPGLVAGILARS